MSDASNCSPVMMSALNKAFSMESMHSEAAEEGCTSKALEAATAQLAYYYKNILNGRKYLLFPK